MAIFKRHEATQQTTAVPAPETTAQPAQPEPAKMMPPFVSQAQAPQTATAAGVVPPPAAPMYSMRPPETTTRFELDAESTVPEKVKAASEEAQQAAQEVIQRRVRIALERSKAAAPTNGAAPRAAQHVARRVQPQRVREAFDPARAAQTGLLSLAWSWQEAGSPIRAIHAYMQLLERYPDTPAAAAAVSDLVELSDKLAQQGQFQTALAIYDRLEHLV